MDIESQLAEAEEWLDDVFDPSKTEDEEKVKDEREEEEKTDKDE